MVKAISSDHLDFNARIKRLTLSFMTNSVWETKEFTVSYDGEPVAGRVLDSDGEIVKALAGLLEGDCFEIDGYQYRLEAIEYEDASTYSVPVLERKLIKIMAIDRKIERLVHFTRLENAALILKLGLLPSYHLKGLGITFIPNDHLRLDGCQDANCLSISFPNYKFFYKRHGNGTNSWVVLELDPSILWKKDCAFCTSNAASSEMINTPKEELKGALAFAELFKDWRTADRNRLGIPDNYPTNPQAEVLVFEPIPPKYITRIVVKNEWDAHKIKTDLPVEVDLTLLSRRQDHFYWGG